MATILALHHKHLTLVKSFTPHVIQLLHGLSEKVLISRFVEQKSICRTKDAESEIAVFSQRCSTGKIIMDFLFAHEFYRNCWFLLIFLVIDSI